MKVSVRKEDSERMKQMLNYIHSHYAEKLSLEKIASAASIGIRECSRCFDRSIRQSPMNYVSQYRVQMALELLMTTGYTITEISEMCGFSSVSYFGKVFRKYISVTPVQYRAQLEKLTYIKTGNHICIFPESGNVFQTNVILYHNQDSLLEFKSIIAEYITKKNRYQDYNW